jgi:hypothetical protein
MKRSLALAFVSVLATACSDQQIACPQIASPGVAVEVRDAPTGALAASGAKLVAQAGTYADSMSFPANQSDADAQHLTGAYRAGVYTLTVTKAGYQPWIKTNVEVSAADCGVNRVDLTALLQPAP